MGAAVRGPGLQGLYDHLLYPRIIDRAGTAGAGLIHKTIKPVLNEPPPPLAHRGRRDFESAGHLQIRPTVRALKDDA
jgi:hypothetical protein